MDEDRGRRIVTASAMRELMGHPAWDTYRRAMEEMEVRMQEQLETTLEDHRFYQGRLEGLRAAYRLPEILIQQGEK